MWKQRLDPGLTYVVDLVQMPDGMRYLQPRLADSPPTKQAVLSSQPYEGGDLMSWREYGRVTEFVELEDGSRFFLDPHGVWLLPEEAEFLRGRRHLQGGDPPWFNGIAPRFPPK